MTLAATTIPITISLITAVCRGDAHDFLLRRAPRQFTGYVALPHHQNAIGYLAATPASRN
jgi:hypothetical protein